MKFSRETVALIKQCIDEKWIPILEEKGEDWASRNCVLCKTFGECKGCPISFFAEAPFCENTPYITWRNHIFHHHKADLPTGMIDICCKIYVLEEIRFLKQIYERALLLMEI